MIVRFLESQFFFYATAVFYDFSVGLIEKNVLYDYVFSAQYIPSL